MRPEFDHPVWDDLFMSVVELARVTRSRAADEETTKAIRRLMGPLEYIARRDFRRTRGGFNPHARHLLKELEEIVGSDLRAKSASEAPEDESGA